MHGKENLNIVYYFFCSLLVCVSGGWDESIKLVYFSSKILHWSRRREYAVKRDLDIKWSKSSGKKKCIVLKLAPTANGKGWNIASGSFIIFQVFGYIPSYSLNSSKTGRVVSFSHTWILTEKSFEQYCLPSSQDRIMWNSVSLSILWLEISFLQLCLKILYFLKIKK